MVSLSRKVLPRLPAIPSKAFLDPRCGPCALFLGFFVHPPQLTFRSAQQCTRSLTELPCGRENTGLHQDSLVSGPNCTLLNRWILGKLYNLYSLRPFQIMIIMTIIDPVNDLVLRKDMEKISRGDKVSRAHV